MWQGLPVFLLDARTRSGQSGAPVLRHVTPQDLVRLEGGGVLHHEATVTELIGVYSGRLHPDSDLGRVFTTQAIREVLTELR